MSILAELVRPQPGTIELVHLPVAGMFIFTQFLRTVWLQDCKFILEGLDLLLLFGFAHNVRDVGRQVEVTTPSTTVTARAVEQRLWHIHPSGKHGGPQVFVRR